MRKVIFFLLAVAIFSVLTNWGTLALMSLFDFQLSLFMSGFLTTATMIILPFLIMGLFAMIGGPRRREFWTRLIDAMK